MYTLNCKGNLIDLAIPKVMGIINVTPDSFYDGGKTTVLRDIVAQAEKMVAAGTTFLDIGGYSSRPGAKDITVNEELERLIPVVETLSKEFPETYLSVDTFRNAVAEQAVNAGAAIVNDISGGMLDAEMLPTVGKLKVPYILMHMKGTPQTMNSLAQYKNVTKELLYYFSERIALARKAGINDIVVDPGFGFAKKREHSFELLKHLELFKTMEVPLLVGVSRKSFIYKTLENTPQEALNGTTVLNTLALQKGASILRVHDVKEAKECIRLLHAVYNTD
ncbi:dihydropteroate synthase [Marinirhabdus gelatinilytica]|uniref:Dihydropteroate synthase n=1 Tax=Marinirhabdus gelatinilytica TaxID=1703343 RepID=A0A370Q8M6_9FLAO|nr:dihydropteroate synthase [Marinirhabdus gelatinilytica]RDK84705.1 dihydropteroate synthase [Marinirhabdus gelatinilytica]